MAKKLRMDWILFAIAASLALFGAVMVYSASAMISLKETAGNADGATQFQYFFKQFSFTLAGLFGMYVVSRVDYRLYQNKTVIVGLLVVTAILLISVFAFPPINGARRWIRIAGMSFQPSELAKIALPLFLAWFLTEKERVVGDLKQTVLPCLAVLAFFGGLILLEPDLGTAIVLCAIFTAVYFAAGARILHLVFVAAGLFACAAGMLLIAPWRIRRIIAFFDPCGLENAAGAGYQVCQSLLAIGSGGVFGEGFAKGQQKLFYLPYPYSDFVFAVVGEELGLAGTLAVVVAFGFLLWRGTRAALLAPDRFGKLLGIGLTTGLIVQALFNISVVISILPPKGIPLPFISYGGTSIVLAMIAVGILLNISQFAGFAAVDRPEPTRTSRRRAKRARAVG